MNLCSLGIYIHVYSHVNFILCAMPIYDVIRWFARQSSMCDFCYLSLVMCRYKSFTFNKLWTVLEMGETIWYKKILQIIIFELVIAYRKLHKTKHPSHQITHTIINHIPIKLNHIFVYIIQRHTWLSALTLGWLSDFTKAVTWSVSPIQMHHVRYIGPKPSLMPQYSGSSLNNKLLYCVCKFRMF